jgi:hypothetical protein
MDAKSARHLLDSICVEMSAPPVSPSFLKRVVRPVGLGLMLSMGPLGLSACGESRDLYGGPPMDGRVDKANPKTDINRSYDKLPPAGDVYGITDKLPPTGDAYGIVDALPKDSSPDTKKDS